MLPILVTWSFIAISLCYAQITCDDAARTDVISDDDFSKLAMEEILNATAREICRAGDHPLCLPGPCTYSAVAGAKYEVLLNNSPVIGPEGGSADTSEATCNATMVS